MANTKSDERVGSYRLGDVFESHVTAQGMVAGHRYRVVAVHKTSNFTGVYYTYDVVDTHDNLALQRPVGNLHMLSHWVEEASS